jgi:hypothetical protein
MLIGSSASVAVALTEILLPTGAVAGAAINVRILGH